MKTQNMNIDNDSFIPGQYNDAHVYYIQLINRLIETATMEQDTCITMHVVIVVSCLPVTLSN